MYNINTMNLPNMTNQIVYLVLCTNVKYMRSQIIF